MINANIVSMELVVIILLDVKNVAQDYILLDLSQKKEVGRSDRSDGIDWNMGICLGRIVGVLDERFRIIRR